MSPYPTEDIVTALKYRLQHRTPRSTFSRSSTAVPAMMASISIDQKHSSSTTAGVADDCIHSPVDPVPACATLRRHTWTLQKLEGNRPTHLLHRTHCCTLLHDNEIVQHYMR